MTEESAPAICIEKHFSASSERVFDAWFDPEHIASWLFPSEEIVSMEQDPKVGGTFNFVIRRSGKNIEHSGEYLEISRPNFLTFTWEVPQFSPQSSLVRITLEVVHDESKLSLTHDNVLAEYQEATKTGWTRILDNLEKELT